MPGVCEMAASSRIAAPEATRCAPRQPHDSRPMRKLAMSRGSARKSAASVGASLPTMSVPRRIACRLNSVENTVKPIDEIRLVRRFGVCRSQCTRNSSECEKTGSSDDRAESSLPFRLDLAESLRHGSVKARSHCAKNPLCQHGDHRGFPALAEIRKQKDEAAHHRTRDGGFPDPQAKQTH